ncbi:MAG: sialidase family protein [candidate division WOR-3 bacterium]|nr:sialidase family protein [candidate division WOR-3 bacterium]
MKSTLLLLVSATIALGWFGPNVRVDHKKWTPWDCLWPAITLGPGAPPSQPVYVVFEADTAIFVRADVMFQKSTDAGRTWLPADVLVRCGCPGAFDPDITTDSDGNIYVVFGEYDPDSVPDHRFCCMKSTDGGATWSPPSRVDDGERGITGRVRIASDPAGNLLCAWNESRAGSFHIWSSTSTDRGATWSQSVRVDDDTTDEDCFLPDVFVQPGSNHYLVVAEVIGSGCYLYRSTDMGHTYQPGVRLDTRGCAFGPHVVADAQHVVCDYTGDRGLEARTLYTEPDTWGVPHVVGPAYQSGKLAISADGSVHTVRQAGPPGGGPYYAYYDFSSDHGVSWSNPEPANDDTNAEAYDVDIAVNSDGHAFIVWRNLESGGLWFATNNPAAIAEQPPQQRIGVQPLATVIRSVLFLQEAASHRPQAPSCLLDISGREVMDLNPGANDMSALAPGVYFVRPGSSAVSRQPSAVTKVVVAR